MLGSRIDYNGLSPVARSMLMLGPRKSHGYVERFSEGGVEPRLDDLLNDPITAAIMRRDGVSISHLQTLIGEARQVLRERRPGA